MVRLTKINCALYGLNTYGLSLTVALAEGLAEREREQLIIAPGPPTTLLAKAAEIHKNGKNGTSPPTTSDSDPSFGALFRRSVDPVANPSPELIVV